MAGFNQSLTLLLTRESVCFTVFGEASKPPLTIRSTYRSGSRTVITAIFMPELCREGREYNTRKGNNLAYLLLGFEPPDTNGSSKALWCWLFNRQQKGLKMTTTNINAINASNPVKSYSEMTLTELWAERLRLLELCSIEENDELANQICMLYCSIDDFIVQKPVKSMTDVRVKLELIKYLYGLSCDCSVKENDRFMGCVNEISQFLPKVASND